MVNIARGEFNDTKSDIQNAYVLTERCAAAEDPSPRTHPNAKWRQLRELQLFGFPKRPLECQLQQVNTFTRILRLEFLRLVPF
jgi:hypothetical protein